MSGKYEYPELESVRQTLRIKWYRSPINADRLRALSKRSNRQGWIQAGGHFCLYLLLAAICVLFWKLELWWSLVLSLWCLGFVASFFSGTAPHELGHGTVFRSRRLNRLFLYVFSLISWWDPFDYACSHTYHHRYTTHPDADRENLLPIQPSLHPWLIAQLLTVNLFLKPGRNFGKGGFFWTLYLTLRSALGIPGGHTDIPSQEWLGTLHDDQPEAFRQSVVWSRILIGFHALVAVTALITGVWILPLIVTLPSYIAGIGSYLTGVPQHCGLKQNVTDFRKNTRSMKLNPLLEFLYWHMNWHTEHHMYANVPCYNLPSLAAEIQHDMPAPRTLLGAWREMREIQHKQIHQPDYQFETPLPVATDHTAAVDTEGDKQLATSIGDLAPDKLRLP